MKYHNMGGSFIEIILEKLFLEKLFWRNYFREIILEKLLYNIVIFYNSIKNVFASFAYQHTQTTRYTRFKCI